MPRKNVVPATVPETVGGRLRYWRKVSALRLVDLAALINVSQGSLSDLENDKSLPSATTLTGLSLKTDINLCWLLTGMGDIRRPDKEPEKEAALLKDIMEMMQSREFRKIMTRLVAIYREGTPAQKSQLLGFFEGLGT